jgi:hypothetical protein
MAHTAQLTTPTAAGVVSYLGAFAAVRSATDDRSDGALVARVAQGDRRALRLLFVRHQQRVYRFVLRLVANTATAEDVVGDVFLDLWRQAAAFEGRAQLSTWLHAPPCR